MDERQSSEPGEPHREGGLAASAAADDEHPLQS
jgi:hypothetical protein